MPGWAWALVGVAIGIAASLATYGLMAGRICEQYVNWYLGQLARDPVSRELSVREVVARRQAARP
jgi:hypothetical protein